MTDPIADMLTRIRNAVRVERPRVDMPLSKVKRGLAEVLKREGYIWDWREEQRRRSPSKQLSHRAEVRPQRRARDSAHQARQQAGPPRVQPADRAAAGPQRPGNFDHQHQPRRDQRPRSPADETSAAKCCANCGKQSVSYELSAVSRSVVGLNSDSDS